MAHNQRFHLIGGTQRYFGRKSVFWFCHLANIGGRIAELLAEIFSSAPIPIAV